MNGDSANIKQKRFNGSFLLLLLLLGGTLALLCHEGFEPYKVFWANDLPLGALVESSARLPASFFGSWEDFYWLGGPNAGFQPSLTNICMAILSPEHHLKFYVPLSSFFLGFGAWFFFRQLRFGTMACVIGGMGAGLNMHYFSNACWGLGQWSVSSGLILIALGVLVSPDVNRLWMKGVLAGLCTGMAVMEGFDVGAILSLYVAAFVLFRFLSTESDPAKGTGKAFYVGVLLVLSAALISLSTIYTLVATQIKGTTGGGQSPEEVRAAWDKNTQWSLPKLETLRLIIPGLFGYRMDVYTTSGSPSAYYWGSIAEDPHVEELESNDPIERSNAVASLHLPEQVQAIFAGNDMTTREEIINRVRSQMQRRHTGSGEYTGVLVCLLAVFGLANATRKTNSPYSVAERRSVLFWGGAALVSLLAAWGRHGFLYAWIYHLPLVANFRNPVKYLHPLNISLMILAGYGLEVLGRQYLAKTAAQISAAGKRFAVFEKRWVIGCVIVLAMGVAGYLILGSDKPALITHIVQAGFDAADAPLIAQFCIGQVGWFIIYLLLSAGVVVCILGGLLSGRRAIWAWIFLATIMICDLSRADMPWIRYYNYKEKISMNPVVDLLRHEPWEHRVNSRLWPAGGYLTPNLTQLCHWWLENDYPFNHIQSLEIDQDPRMAVLENNYLNQFVASSQNDIWRVTRLWQLTNTRYILAGTDWEQLLNQFGEPKDSFRTVMRMNMVAKPGITKPEDSGDLTVQTNSDGPVALLEFTRALPRAKLYGNWTNVDDSAALQLLGSKEFEPEKTVLVAKDTPIPQVPSQPDADPGMVKISHYESKDLMLEADAKMPAILLLNDRTGDFWNVWIDKQPGVVLRCNYIMRGVFVPAGHHTIEFRYQPSLKLLYVSLTTFGLGILLAGFVVVKHFAREPEPLPDSPAKRRGRSGKS